MQKKILIVDDALIVRTTLKYLFDSNNYQTMEAETGDDAVKKYQTFKPDLVTMDITMPDMDGITAVKEILKTDPKATIVICSAMGQTNKVKAALAAGAKSFIVKPLNPERVLNIVKKFLD
ncbi:MAG: response regulator [Candidatus Rifleibacteriota bacterium]